MLRVLEDKKLPLSRRAGVQSAKPRPARCRFWPASGTFAVAALAKLRKYPDRFLPVARELGQEGQEPPAAHGAESVDEYNRWRRARAALELAHGLIHTMISITGLLAAVWSRPMVREPVQLLPFAAWLKRRRRSPAAISKSHCPSGAARVTSRRLSTTFNTMTREIKHQRDALVTANEQLLDRRRFMEAVLSNVSAGVIGLDSQDRVTLLSRAAEQLYRRPPRPTSLGKKLAEVLPRVRPPAREARRASPRRVLRRKSPSRSAARSASSLSTSRAGSRLGPGDVGSAVTFDDVTESTWPPSAHRLGADVARRIAHEIKNPLTPILPLGRAHPGANTARSSPRTRETLVKS